MDQQALRDEIRFKVTGGVLDLELDDAALDKVINSALREMQRYVCSTKIVTVPYKPCIDVKDLKASTVVGIYRTDSYNQADTSFGISDPVYASQWQLLSNTGNLYNFQNYVLNYSSWNTLLQIRNTASTDLSFKYDKSAEKLYINIATDMPNNITIEYIPRYDSVDEVNSDYWLDVLTRLSVGITKEVVGRIRSRYKQTNAEWEQDGEALLEEGKTELSELRAHLIENSQLIYPLD